MSFKAHSSYPFLSILVYISSKESLLAARDQVRQLKGVIPSDTGEVILTGGLPLRVGYDLGPHIEKGSAQSKKPIAFINIHMIPDKLIEAVTHAIEICRICDCPIWLTVINPPKIEYLITAVADSRQITQEIIARVDRVRQAYKESSNTVSTPLLERLLGTVVPRPEEQIPSRNPLVSRLVTGLPDPTSDPNIQRLINSSERQPTRSVATHILKDLFFRLRTASNFDPNPE